MQIAGRNGLIRSIVGMPTRKKWSSPVGASNRSELGFVSGMSVPSTTCKIVKLLAGVADSEEVSLGSVMLGTWANARCTVHKKPVRSTNTVPILE